MANEGINQAEKFLEVMHRENVAPQLLKEAHVVLALMQEAQAKTRQFSAAVEYYDHPSERTAISQLKTSDACKKMIDKNEAIIDLINQYQAQSDQAIADAAKARDALLLMVGE